MSLAESPGSRSMQNRIVPLCSTNTSAFAVRQEFPPINRTMDSTEHTTTRHQPRFPQCRGGPPSRCRRKIPLYTRELLFSVLTARLTLMYRRYIKRSMADSTEKRSPNTYRSFSARRSSEPAHVAQRWRTICEYQKSSDHLHRVKVCQTSRAPPVGLANRWRNLPSFDVKVGQTCVNVRICAHLPPPPRC
jgi:hypothetical protein